MQHVIVVMTSSKHMCTQSKQIRMYVRMSKGELTLYN